MALREPDLPRSFPAEVYEWTDEQWAAAPVSVVPTDSLVPSQDDVSLYHLAAIINSDPDPEHVGRAIYWRGRLNLFDGHHHWIVAAARGWPEFRVRILTPESAPIGTYEAGLDGYRIEV